MQLITVSLNDSRTAHVAVTDATDGDLAIDSDPAPLDRRRRGLVDRPWTWLRQVHGGDVVLVDRPGEHAGREADASITTRSGFALAVQTADCGSLAIIGRGGEGGTSAVAAVHAGWRGVVAGIVPHAIEAVRKATGSGDVVAVLGPCIHAECYEFAATDLALVEAVTGPIARGRTAAETLALDLPAALRGVLERHAVELVWSDDRCTSCDRTLWSHRARADRGRQGLVVWIDDDVT